MFSTNCHCHCLIYQLASIAEVWYNIFELLIIKFPFTLKCEKINWKLQILFNQLLRWRVNSHGSLISKMWILMNYLCLNWAYSWETWWITITPMLTLAFIRKTCLYIMRYFSTDISAFSSRLFIKHTVDKCWHCIGEQEPVHILCIFVFLKQSTFKTCSWSRVTIIFISNNGQNQWHKVTVI